jgi:hypothetical protein
MPSALAKLALVMQRAAVIRKARVRRGVMQGSEVLCGCCVDGLNEAISQGRMELIVIFGQKNRSPVQVDRGGHAKRGNVVVRSSNSEKIVIRMISSTLPDLHTCTSVAAQ